MQLERSIFLLHLYNCYYQERLFEIVDTMDTTFQILKVDRIKALGPISDPDPSRPLVFMETLVQ